MQSTAE